MGVASRPRGGPNIVGDKAGLAFRAKSRHDSAGPSATKERGVLMDAELKEKARRSTGADKDKEKDKELEEVEVVESVPQTEGMIEVKQELSETEQTASPGNAELPLGGGVPSEGDDTL